MPFTTPLVSCAMNTLRATRAPLTQPDPCQFPTDVRDTIPIDDDADVNVVYSRSASSNLNVDHYVGSFYDLSAESTLAINDEIDHLRIYFGDVESVLDFVHEARACGGCAIPQTHRCLDQVGHGLTIGQWIILDQVSQEWIPAYDAGGTTEDDAVAMVTLVDGDHFCYKAIGPICTLEGTLTPGETYYVRTDGSGAISTTEPGDISTPRFFAISSSEAILLPYRPLDASALSGRQIDVFDVDATIAATKQITLTSTPIAGSEDVYINGVLATRGGTRDYTMTGNVITFNSHMGTACKLTVGDLITVKYST